MDPEMPYELPIYALQPDISFSGLGLLRVAGRDCSAILPMVLKVAAIKKSNWTARSGTSNAGIEEAPISRSQAFSLI